MIELALTAQILLWVLVVSVFLASRQASLFHPLTLYLGFHAVVFVIRPLQVLLMGFDFGWQYIRFDPTEADLTRTFAVTSAGLIVFTVATLAAGWSRTEFPKALPEPFTPAQRKALLVTTLLLAPIALYSIYRTSTGGFKGEERGAVFVLTGDSGYTVEAQFLAGPLICAWMLVTRFSWRGVLPLVVYIAYRSSQGWNRWTIVLLAFALATTYAWQQRRRWLPLGVILALLPVLFLFHALGRDRGSFRYWLEGKTPPVTVETAKAGMQNREKLKRNYDGPDYANFDFLTFILSIVPNRTGTFTYGTQYLQLFTEPIPRKLWPGKPLGPPIVFFSLNKYGNFMGMTPTLLGDGWMSGGWPGVILTVGLAGGLLGWLHRRFWRYANSNQFCLCYIVGLAMLPQWFRDGSISIAKFLFWNLTPLLVWVLCTWLIGGTQVAAGSVLLRPGTRVRLLAAEASKEQ